MNTQDAMVELSTSPFSSASPLCSRLQGPRGMFGSRSKQQKSDDCFNTVLYPQVCFLSACKIKSAEHVHEVHERSVDNTAQVALPQRRMQPTILVAMATVCLACAPGSKKQMRSLVGCTHVNRGGRSSNTKKAYNYRPAMPRTDFYTL